jgi:hypothetical protein
MPIVNPDTSNISEQGPIDPGTYKAKIVGVDFQTSKSSGNPMIVPNLEVDVNGKMRPRKTWLVITGEGAYGFDNLLRACGFDEIADQFRDPAVQPKPDFDTDQLIGQEVNVVIEPDTYNGQLRDKVRSFLRA